MTQRNHKNIAEKLVEEFERIIIVREGYRNLFKLHPPTNEMVVAERLGVITQLNEIIDECKTALGTDDALTTLKALESAARVD